MSSAEIVELTTCPGGAYENFAGRDASRGVRLYIFSLLEHSSGLKMAKQSFDEGMLTPIDQPIDDLSDLTPSERENMRGRSAADDTSSAF